ncbi:MAG: sortase [Anaerolineae bacterium]|nr:sortase [Anaerolineae bacterium]
MVRFWLWFLILMGGISIIAGIFYLSQEEEPLEVQNLTLVVPAVTAETSPTPELKPSVFVSPQLSLGPSPTPELKPSVFVSPQLSLELSLTPSPTPAPRPVRIIIPAIKVDAPVVEVGIKIVHTKKGLQAQWEVAEYAAGHHSTSASPGEGGNIVISGHHNVKGKVFQRLWELKPGDRVLLYNAEGKVFIYEVKEVLLLREKGVSEEQRRANARYMDPTPDETLTLITCWPPRGNSHRVIVIAKPFEPGQLKANMD